MRVPAITGKLKAFDGCNMTQVPPVVSSSISTISVDELVSALELRTSWTLIRKALKLQKLPVGIGWKDLKGHAAENNAVGAKLRVFLQQYFEESIITGERFVQLYSVEKDLVSSIVATANTVTMPTSGFSKKYPLPLDVNILASAPSDPTLCAVRTNSKGDISFIFCSAGYYDDRTSYEYGQLSELVQKTYGGIDKLITVCKSYYQAYDVITLRVGLERLEISVDQPGRLGSARLETKPMEILSACALHIHQLQGFGARPPENLFAAISSMYSAANEGKVTALAFRTTTGSVKRERMTTSSDDLRDERFHHAGMVAVGQDIKPYEVEIEWDFTLPEGSAELKLAGMLSQLASASPTLHGCYVSAHQSSSFEKALNRLVTYIET
jgi:hypothetical protein